MHHSVSAVLLFLLLAGEGTALAQSPASTVGLSVRRVELGADEAQPAVEVAVSPGLSTVFLFDSEVSREGLTFEGRERFAMVDTGLNTLRLIPSDKISAGERLTLTVRFQDGAAPASATFVLVAHPARSEALVEVYRRKRSVETYQEEVRQARIEAEKCREENERLRAERNAPDGLTGLISTEVLSGRGVEFRDVTKDVTQGPGGAAGKHRVLSYRAARRVAVEVFLVSRGDDQQWTAKGATLRGKANEELKVLQVWQSGPVASGSTVQRVVVEAEAASESPQGPFTLKLWDADGRRTVTLGNVTFP
ncbi:DUF2381 family protein [Myxococcus xanthus]|uniref:DUF2381 family protein n=1 Tax=Myxococcus xanthus TaxID=34 RepID=UPI000311430B|nr:DUF2381 family protein [Myxococcus xanthus]QVW70544.1 DUF2381 family protein [Myxococcus xanthus DZ2]QZZ49425.1 hypothetical protein MyxoNM_09450 [Myxococcus xanthus]UEO03328.1 DUF2381 family protein [Myxococcus xanthus DZ2]UYI16508.1 DUF2381 family protein [Myxococcus xanthus]UYI23870.1 DUF2381 family protein [Myxococcus xanthus]